MPESKNWQIIKSLIDQTRQLILLDMASDIIKQLHSVYGYTEMLKALRDYTKAESDRDPKKNASWRVVNESICLAIKKSEQTNLSQNTLEPNSASTAKIVINKIRQVTLIHMVSELIATSNQEKDQFSNFLETVSNHAGVIGEEESSSNSSWKVIAQVLKMAAVEAEGAELP